MSQTITEPTVRRTGVTWVATIPDHLIPADDRYYREATDDGPLEAHWSFNWYVFSGEPYVTCIIATWREGEFYPLNNYSGDEAPSWVPRPEQDAVEAMLRYLMGGSDE